jgi:hypothetical protein
MDKEQFWQIIDGARETAGGWQGMYEPLLTALSQLDTSEIMHWQGIFNEYQELSYKDKLWAAASVILNGCSDDGFDYFRGWLTAQGKEVFMNALADPDSLAGVEAVKMFGREVVSSEYMTPLKGYREESRFEKMLSVAAHAYESKPGSGDFYDDIGSYSLSGREKADIAGEIKYAADIGARWVGGDISREEQWEMYRQSFPRLYGVFYPPVSEAAAELERQDRFAEKESVIAKIREAKKNPPPRIPKEERGGHKKSHEPEV